MYTYTEFFEILEYELNQKKEAGDRGTPNSFRYLPTTEAKRRINEALYYLASLNPSQYNREQIIETRTFSTHVAVEEDVIYVPYDSGKIALPQRVFSVDAIFQRQKWYPLYNSSNLNSDWYSPNKRTLRYRPNNLTDGLQILFHASVLPKELKENVSLTGLTASFSTASCIVVTVGSHKFELGDKITISSAAEPDYDNSNASIIAVTDTEIYVEANTIPFPPSGVTDLVLTFSTDDYLIDIPKQYESMLILELKKRAYQRKRKNMGQSEYAQLALDINRWSSERGQVKQTANFSARGWGFGKR